MNQQQIDVVRHRAPETASQVGITPRIARRGIDTSHRLGRQRWVVERTMSWLAGRRLHRRYERKPEHFLAFTAIATSLINYRRLTK